MLTCDEALELISASLDGPLALSLIHICIAFPRQRWR